jgi:predicted CXXCH cytochrome family protein
MPPKNSCTLLCQRCHEVVASSATPLTLSKPKVFCAGCHDYLLDKAREKANRAGAETQATKDHWNSGGINWND